jgi:hypothetical protein
VVGEDDVDITTLQSGQHLLKLPPFLAVVGADVVIGERLDYLKPVLRGQRQTVFKLPRDGHALA